MEDGRWRMEKEGPRYPPSSILVFVQLSYTRSTACVYASSVCRSKQQKITRSNAGYVSRNRHVSPAAIEAARSRGKRYTPVLIAGNARLLIGVRSASERLWR